MKTNREEGKAAAEIGRLAIFVIGAIAVSLPLLAGLIGMPAYFFQGGYEERLEVVFGILFVAASFALLWTLARDGDA